ncbi:MAG: DinB family protein [Chloroflexi bacterium]|nr:DinB family protein [Chloroflexota bacterium]
MNELLKHVTAVLTTTPLRWNNLTQTIPDELIRQAPAQGEWSALECLLHLVDTERLFQSRLQAFAEGRDLPAFDPDVEGTKLTESTSAKDTAAEFERLRRSTLEMIKALTPPDLDHRSRHTELGVVSLREMLNEWAAHDLNHTMQAERAMMQPFIRDSGPWMQYFTAHIIAT